MNKLFKQNSNFRKIWLSQLISLFGDTFYDVALVWYLMDKTGSALVAGGIAVFDLIGKFVGSLFINQIVDKRKSRSIMIMGDVICAIVLLVSLGAILTDRAPVAFFYLLSFVIALMGAMFSAARSKSIMEVVDEQDYERANSFDNLSRAIVQIFSWILGGIIVQIFGVALALTTNMVTFILSAVLLFTANWKSQIKTESDKNSRKLELITSYKLIKSNRTLVAITVIELFYMTLLGVYWASLPLKVYELGNAFFYGLQGAVFGVGYLITSTYSSYKGFVKNIKKAYIVGIVIHCLGNLFAGVSQNIFLLMCGVFVAGLANTFWQTYKTTNIQKNTSVADAGKIFSSIDTIMNFSMITAWIIGGKLSDMYSPTIVMGCAAGLQLFFIAVLVLKTKLLESNALSV